MQKYTNGTDYRYFEDDVDVQKWINLSEYRLMTNDEILRKETPRPTIWHTIWNGKEWLDKRTKEEILQYERSLYPPITRYQFLRCLLENGYKSSDVEKQIMNIEDEMMREITILGFKEATNFIRTDSSILAMQSVLGLDDEKVDELWKYALTL